MRTARLTRPFWALVCRAPVLLSFPAGIAMEDLATPSLVGLRPQGPARASLVPQQQSQPRLPAQGWPGGSQNRLWHEARMAGAGPWGWGHLGSEYGQLPAWLLLHMAPWCGPPATRVLCSARLPPAQHPRWEPQLLCRPAPPSARFPPRLHSAPPPPAQPVPALCPVPGQRPPPLQPALGSCCSRSRSPSPSPSTRQPGLSPQINGLPNTPAPPVQC